MALSVVEASRAGDAWRENARPLDVAALAALGTVLAIAPHADDESLGCGGLLALLSDAGAGIVPLLVTDNAASHPNSHRFDAAARTALRAREWQAALHQLGVDGRSAIRLGLADGRVPAAGAPGFAAAVERIRTIVDLVQPAVVLLPWRRDPHPDHRATHAIVVAALRDGSVHPRCLEYLVWTAERATLNDLPKGEEVRAWALDIGSVVARKRAAIAEHRSQLGEVITDDPGGFVLDPAMRRRAEQPREYFFEAALP